MPNFLRDRKTIIGMIHVDPLPGTPKGSSSMPEIIANTRQEALLYQEAGIDVLMIENMHDVPFARNIGPEICATMAVIGYEIKQATGLRCGLQILAAANREALAAGLDFVRVAKALFLATWPTRASLTALPAR